MGWANCGQDSKVRQIGYAHLATCDHPGCEAKIDRGLSYVCGTMHGEDEDSCEGYFCGDHKQFMKSSIEVGRDWVEVCEECAKLLEEIDE